MQRPVIPSGSLNSDIVTFPQWNNTSKHFSGSIGSLAHVLPLGGPIWMNELVIVLEIIQDRGLVQMCRVHGRHGEAVFPYHALFIHSTRSKN